MRLLLDECVDERLRLLFPGYDCQTARYAALTGPKNGALLDAAEAAGFDVLITVDQNIPDQQNLGGRQIALVILCGRTSRLRDLELLAPAALSALRSIQCGDVVTIKVDPCTRVGVRIADASTRIQALNATFSNAERTGHKVTREAEALIARSMLESIERITLGACLDAATIC